MKTIWDYRYRFLVYLFLLAVILAVAIWILLYEAKPLTEADRPLTACFYTAPRIIQPDTQVLGTQIGLTENVNFDKLINCLIEHESNGDPNALNKLDTDGLPAFGLLQFKESTFKMYCIDKYGYPDDIWNPSVQYLCAEKMIRSGLLYHWGTARSCVN